VFASIARSEHGDRPEASPRRHRRHRRHRLPPPPPPPAVTIAWS